MGVRVGDADENAIGICVCVHWCVNVYMCVCLCECAYVCVHAICEWKLASAEYCM